MYFSVFSPNTEDRLCSRDKSDMYMYIAYYMYLEASNTCVDFLMLRYSYSITLAYQLVYVIKNKKILFIGHFLLHSHCREMDM
jgi:hypothetical protein